MRFPLCWRPPHRVLRVALCAAVATVSASELWAGQPHSPRRTISATDVGVDAVRVRVSDDEATEPGAQPSRDALAERTLRALGEAASPNRRPRRRIQPRDEASSPASLTSAEEAVVEEPVEERADVRPLGPSPLAVEPLSEERSGWVPAGRRTKMPRPIQPKTAARKAAAPKAAAPKAAGGDTARASVRWAHARTDDGEAVRSAADWSAVATVTLRGPAGRFNPLRAGDGRGEEASVKTRGANPLRAR